MYSEGLISSENVNALFIKLNQFELCENRNDDINWWKYIKMVIIEIIRQYKTVVLVFCIFFSILIQSFKNFWNQTAATVWSK